MEPRTFITVAQSSGHLEDFTRFMNATTDALRIDGKKRQSYYITRNGDKLEEDVLNCMKQKATEFHFDPDLIQHTPPQHFPDIVSNNYFGIEVKSTKKNAWQSTGSSIVESLRKDDIKKVFMLFGILSKENIDFRCKPYEKCLSEIAVTHSPRYLINMDLSEDESTIFDKMNIDYDTFRSLGNLQIDKVREYYRGKYKKKNVKSMPWWIGDDADTPYVPNDYELRLLSDVGDNTKNFLISRCYALFPEILGTDQDKFRKPVLWMCTRHSIICSNIRDQFSAGGTGNIYVNDSIKWKDIPKVICNLLPYISIVKNLFSNDKNLQSDFEDFAVFTTKSNITYEDWKNAANAEIANSLKDNNVTIRIEELQKYKFICRKTIEKKHCYFLKYK